MNGKGFNLEEKVKAKFKLFSGVRSQEEDQMIFDKVMDLCFDEIAEFTAENLEDSEMEAMKLELDKVHSDEEKQKIMIEYLAKIKDYQERLSSKLNSYLDQLLFNSIKNLKN